MTVSYIFIKTVSRSFLLSVLLIVTINLSAQMTVDDENSINESFINSPYSLTLLEPYKQAQNEIKAFEGTNRSVESASNLSLSSQSTIVSTMNYILSRAFRKEYASVSEYISSTTKTVSDAIEQVQYFDGLGRLIQAIDIKGSPTNLDMIAPTAYNIYGQEITKYLPYVISGDGSYRPQAILSEQKAFYNATTLAGLDRTDNRPYSEISYEKSPLARIFSALGPGDLWSTTNSIKYEYGSNDLNTGVILWKVDNSDGCIRSGTYDPNKLYAISTTDENGNKTSEYKDIQERIVLKIAPLNARTYYVYDDIGNLRYVIPPEAIQRINTGGLTDAIKNDYCYYYKYDNKNRLIEKKLPGAEKIYMVYDRRDRLILSQDGNQRLLNQWLFTKYDALNRPVILGIYTHSGVTDQVGMDAIVTQAKDSLFEVRTSANPATQYGYSNQSFPKSNTTILTLTYYDNYDFNSDGSPDRSFVTDGLTSESGTSKLGLKTGSKVRIVDDTKFVESAIFYDKYGRIIQTQQIQPVDGNNTANTRISNKINLLGEILQSKSTMTIGSFSNTVLDEYMLDHRGRLLEQKKSIDGQTAKTIFSNTYNQLGQLVIEKMGISGSNALQKLDYLYNIRGWLRGLNYTPETNDLFAMQLFYNEYLTDLGSKANYNGNISSIKWNNKKLGTIWDAYGFNYDVLNRLTDAIYGEYTQAGSAINTGFRGAEYKNRYDEKLTYSMNGNIVTLSRRGLDNPSLQTFAEIDNMVYTYSGNKLTKVDDSRPDVAERGDFFEKVSASTEYFYDANGNMNRDDNKGIVKIDYNFLNLPKQVNFTTANDYIKYVYNAEGIKLKKIVVKGGTTQYTENYIGNLVFKTTGSNAFSASNDLNYMIAEKGRLVKSAGIFIYEYYLKDHLGNTRVIFTDNNLNGTIENNTTEIPQYTDYYPFGLIHNRASSLTDDNRQLYNGKELQSETFNLDATTGNETMFDCYDYGARFYDPQIGRFHSIDPWAEKYRSWSPYVYALDNPVRYVDINGCGAGDPLKKMQLRGHYSTWGTGQSKFGKVRGSDYHQGYDLYAPKGTSVSSVGTGTVVKVETHKDFGQQVIVKYPTLTKKDGTEVKDVYVRYAHFSETNVKKDDPVTETTNLGKTGQTGNAEGQSADKAHLHIEYMKSEDPGTGESGNNNRYDPGDFLTVDDAVETEQTGNESDWTTTETTTETTTTTTETSTATTTETTTNTTTEEDKKNQ